MVYSMCGIAGIFSMNKQNLNSDDIKKMTKAIIHRGPDSEGFYFGSNIHLGSRRLSIQDIEEGNQPIFNEDKTIVIILNGEIYNYVQERKILEKHGHIFKTNTDTELLVHMYELYGEEFIKKLQGQFAYAIYDKRKNILLLGRDRSGICPLYYAILGGSFYFSSEVKSMAQLSWFQGVPDILGIAEALKYWSSIPPRTIFKGISCVPASNYIIVDPEKDRVTVQPYHYLNDYIKDMKINSAPTAKKQIRDNLTKAVKRRINADEEIVIGAYISGGLDSTIIANTLGQLSNNPIKTFSVSFDSKSYDESEFQKKCIENINCQHTEVHISDEDIVKAFPEVILHTEFPFFRTAPIPMYLLAKEVHKQGVKVILSGEGADEIFYGYDSFKDTLTLNYWSNSIDSAIRPEKLKEYHTELEGKELRYKYLQSYYKKYAQKFDYPLSPLMVKWENGSQLFSFFTAEIQDLIKAYDLDQDLLEVFPKEFKDLDGLKRCQGLEMELLLGGYLLSSQGDRVLYANSVEGRYPFLDEDVVKLAYNLPDFQKMRGFQEKFILREAYKGIIPEEIRLRKKYPYHASSSKVFFEYRNKYPYVEALLSKERIQDIGIFEYNKVSTLINKYIEGSRSKQPSSREDLIIMFILGTQAVFSAARNKFKQII